MNPALEDQAVGRAWRMGQKRRVTVKRLFVKGTLEESIMALSKERRVRPASRRAYRTCPAVLFALSWSRSVALCPGVAPAV